MADEVSIRVTADVSSLQDGMRQAANAIQTTMGSLRSGAEQISASFASVSQSYERNTAGKIAAAKAAGDAELAIARQTQSQIGDVASQSALRRIGIERATAQQIHGDYASTFVQIGSIASSSVVGIMTAHARLRETVRSVLAKVIETFVQANVKMVAAWLSGTTAQTAITAQGEAVKTAAVTAGVAARTSAETAGSHTSLAAVIPSILKSIMASAGETFAGIFGFLSPVMGPAAAGPAAAGEATVLSVGSGLASFATGAWSLPSDMIAQVHQGEMIIPAGPARAFRSMVESGSSTGGVHVHHSTNFSVNAMDSQSVRQFFKTHSKTIMRAINEGVRTGSHLGLSRLSTAI